MLTRRPDLDKLVKPSVDGATVAVFVRETLPYDLDPVDNEPVIRKKSGFSWWPWLVSLILAVVSAYFVGDKFITTTRTGTVSVPIQAPVPTPAPLPGKNHCLELLKQWSRDDRRFNWTPQDAEQVAAAIRADGG